MSAVSSTNGSKSTNFADSQHGHSEPEASSEMFEALSSKMLDWLEETKPRELGSAVLPEELLALSPLVALNGELHPADAAPVDTPDGGRHEKPVRNRQQTELFTFSGGLRAS